MEVRMVSCNSAEEQMVSLQLPPLTYCYYLLVLLRPSISQYYFQFQLLLLLALHLPCCSYCWSYRTQNHHYHHKATIACNWYVFLTVC